MSQVEGMRMARFLVEVEAEVTRARKLFPSNKHLIAAMSEESGELVKAVLDHEQKGAPAEDIWKEGVQAAAMVVRLVLEGDPSVRYQGPE